MFACWRKGKISEGERCYYKQCQYVSVPTILQNGDWTPLEKNTP